MTRCDLWERWIKLVLLHLERKLPWRNSHAKISPQNITTFLRYVFIERTLSRFQIIELNSTSSLKQTLSQLHFWTLEYVNVITDRIHSFTLKKRPLALNNDLLGLQCEFQIIFYVIFSISLRDRNVQVSLTRACS